jgi:voltage-gated potassium channel Kch
VQFKSGSADGGVAGDEIVDRFVAPPLGLDQRYVYVHLRSQGVSPDEVGVTSYRSKSRSLASTSHMIRAIATSPPKAETDTTSEVVNAPLKQIATVSTGTPNVLLANQSFRSWVNTDLAASYRRALDAHIIGEIQGAGIDAAAVVLPMALCGVLRSVRVLRALRVARAGTYMARGAKKGRSVFSRENFSYAMVVTFIALGGTALLVWGIEREAPEANIHTLPDAVWWAITTISTVGYGDKFPVTPEGRAIAIVLMVLGIGLFGLIAATLSSFFIEQQHKGQFDNMFERLEELEKSLAELTTRMSESTALSEERSGDREIES